MKFVCASVTISHIAHIVRIFSRNFFINIHSIYLAFGLWDYQFLRDNNYQEIHNNDKFNKTIYQMIQDICL